MQIIGAFEAKTHFSALLEKVERGEQVVITKYGHPIAKIISTRGVDRIQVKNAIDKLKVFNKTNRLDGLNWKDLRDEGRR